MIVLIGYDTDAQSELKVKEGDTTLPYTYGSGPLPAASDYFMDGAPLTGQSDHILNFQIGLEDTDRLSRSEEHTSELQSLMRISYAVFCLTKKNNTIIPRKQHSQKTTKLRHKS